jgi:hypothetical protein
MNNTRKEGWVLNGYYILIQKNVSLPFLVKTRYYNMFLSVFFADEYVNRCATTLSVGCILKDC